MRANLVLAMLLALGTGDTKAEEMFSANKKPISNLHEFWELSVTAKTDVLDIRSFSVNRGCHTEVPRFPLVLKLGQTAQLGVIPCDPIELTIETQQGGYNVSWDTGDYSDRDFIARKAQVTTFQNGFVSSYWVLYATNIGEQAELRSFVVNKGQCSTKARIMLKETPNSEFKLDFGDRYGVALFNCNPLSLTINSTRGTSTFTWDQ
ncbi:MULTISPECIES: hypothetical protein [unclassified Shinella]|uniref:hypothetical protein n=1 Tax=unclassified Shinella TaxID=2643062 RepID=UPI00234F2581|nr:MULTISPECIES: hypothetical protein [unclassified Shinella]MCO5137423.1 hypothetical protein [Shinella sp.]MDC7257399.1 hypothetical protein [Shinella sp. YE25]